MQRDKKLIQQLKNGDKDALRILYVEHKDFLLTLANALLHDITAAEDVIHDVFVNFIRNIGTFRLTGKLRGYLAVCAANEARSHLRKRKIHAKNLDFAPEPQATEPPCPVEAKEIVDRFRNYLAQLPAEQREVIILRIKADLKFKDIARLQQTTVSTVQGRYRYGIEKLRVLLNGEF